MKPSFTSCLDLQQVNFIARAFDADEKCIYVYEGHNKVTLGAGRQLVKMLAGHTQGWNPASSNIGITKFVLFGIDATESVGSTDCETQMLAGDFGTYFTNLDPILLSSIDATAFPCLLASDNISVTTVPVNSCATLTTPTVDDTSYMSSDVTDNELAICIRVGPGYVAQGLQKYYAMAALVGKSVDPSDTNEYCFALEQFPVMIKTNSVTFRFLWTISI